MAKISEQKYMEESWKKEKHQAYKTELIDKSVKEFAKTFKMKETPLTLLDIGCGNGKNSIFLQKQGFKVTGIDFSSEAIKICKKKSQKVGLKPTFKQGSALDFKSKQKFDIIIDCGCLHHIKRSEWKDYKKTILNNLEVGGTYYLHGISDCKENKKLPKHPDKRNWVINKKGHYTTFLSKKDITKTFGNKIKILKEFDFKSEKSPLMVKAFFLKRTK